ncbi:Signal transduction histidine kinase [Pseudoalteromonas luteoviolacea B = ATCC 29581]|nr:Signal transduction histidine kinase [Pseudoalteromonas luteoviolacea B = ATCC 29581]
MLSENDIVKLQKEGQIDSTYGTMPQSWMGVPVIYEDIVLGLIIVQSYTNKTQYDERDLELLAFTADNISVVLKQREILEREKLANQALKSSVDIITRQKLDLEETMSQLKNTQKELIQKEKLASLGALVAGVAHEINTPLGICVTGISSLDYNYKQFIKAMENGTATDRQLQQFLEDVGDMCKIITSNVQRAADLIQGFKQISVDQSSESMRLINLLDYTNEVIHSLAPMIKKSSHSIKVQGESDINIFTKPGAISQLITNLVSNAFLHAFENRENGVVDITVFKRSGKINFDVSDNGMGMNQEQLSKIFEPFYTTKRGKGGSGLGSHIVYNIVTSILKGKISVSSEENKGTKFSIVFPEIHEGDIVN